MKTIRIKHPEVYKPLDEPYRYKIMYGGRGSAKSWTVARKLLLRGVEKKLLILCTRELQKSIKQSVHRLLSNQIKRMGLDGFYEILDTVIRGANGTEFIFIGVKHNTEEIKSMEGVDICWIEEGQKLTLDSWDTIDPTIRAENSEIWVTYNTRYKFDTIHQLFVMNIPLPDSWVKLVNYHDNPFFPEVLKKQMEHMKATEYDKYLHIWKGELKALAEGAIFGDQILETKKEGRLLNIPIEKACEVHTFWDLGKNDHTSIWFMQHVGNEYRFIDYYENRLKDIDHYCNIIKDKGYLYGSHYMPHDVDVQLLGMNISRKIQFQNGGVKPIEVVPRIADKMDGIEAARQIFNKCWFDKTRCERGFEALSNYRYIFDDERDAYRLKPHHDWASNGSDAFMQFAQGYKVDDEEFWENESAGVGL